MGLVPSVSLLDGFSQRLHVALFVPCPVFAFGLGIDQPQIERHGIVVVETDNPHSAAVANPRPAPATFAQAASIRDNIARIGIGNDVTDKCIAIVFCP